MVTIKIRKLFKTIFLFFLFNQLQTNLVSYRLWFYDSYIWHYMRVLESWAHSAQFCLLSKLLVSSVSFCPGRSTWDLLSCSGHFSLQSWHQHVASHTQLWAQDSQIGAMIAYILLLLLNIELVPVKSQKGFIHFPNTKPEGKDWGVK